MDTAPLSPSLPRCVCLCVGQEWSLLPFTSKLLLVSSFVAGYNTPTNDWRLMRPDSAGTSGGRQQNHRRQTKAQKQLMDEMDIQVP